MKLTLQARTVGTVLRYTVRNAAGALVDLTTATITLYLKRPGPTPEDPVVLAKSIGAGTDVGTFDYRIVAGDLPYPGMLESQAKVVIGSDTIPTDVTHHTIAGNLY